MNHLAKQLSGIVAAFLFLTLPACSSERPEETGNPYDQLCVIYEEELAGKELPGPATFQRLSNRVDDELPELKDQFGHLVNFPKEEFYPALKKMAENYTGETWECGFIKRYYKS